MALKCEICGKGAIRAANRSHSKTKTLRRQKPNLQKMNGKKVCTRCIRTASKVAKGSNASKGTNVVEVANVANATMV